MKLRILLAIVVIAFTNIAHSKTQKELAEKYL